MKIKQKKIIYLVGLALIVAALILLLFIKDKKVNKIVDNTPFRSEQGRLIVTTSLFPIYDFAKIIGGDKAQVFLILPPGSEAHAYVPSNQDKETIKNSALFFYTSDLMESWAPSLVSELSVKTKAVATANNLNDSSLDPHVWLDFSKASLMVDNIANAYKALDPQNASYYEQNANNYKQQLAKLDTDFATGLKDCQFHEFVSGGHMTFAYLAKRYNLKYQAAEGFIPNAKIDTDRVLKLSKEIKDSKQPYVYYEELVMPYLAELIHQESSARIMPLNSAHNIAKFDIESGITFIGLMESDLKILRMGLVCR